MDEIDPLTGMILAFGLGFLAIVAACIVAWLITWPLLSWWASKDTQNVIGAWVAVAILVAGYCWIG